MSLELVLMLVTVAVAFLGLLVEMAYRSDSTRTTSKPAADPIPEIPPLDPLVLCPVCHLMGPHSIEEVPARPPAPIKTIEHPDGSVDEIFTWQSAAGTSGHFVRRCAFYPDQHVWSVPLSART